MLWMGTTWMPAPNSRPILCTAVRTDRYQHWNFSFVSEDGIELDNPETWLAYYASDRDRKEWAGCFGEAVPEKQIPRYHRDFPQDCTFSY